jgi:two-component system CheB/CheR fusion protein
MPHDQSPRKPGGPLSLPPGPVADQRAIQADAPAELTPVDILPILQQLRAITGHDFSLYKKSTVARRIGRCMAQYGIKDEAQYVLYLKDHPSEAHHLLKEILVNVTSFFRDPGAFAALKDTILPALLKHKPTGYDFRVWVAGCASGEEAYSIAIVLTELLDTIRARQGAEPNIQIYATDLDEDAIAQARAGRYPPNIAQDLTPERLRRFFIKDETGYKITKDIRDLVVFAVHNVVKDPPFTRLDLLSCRNLLIYLEPELQNRLMPNFHYALRPDGALFLAMAESYGKRPDLFSETDRKWKFYRAKHKVPAPETPRENWNWTSDKVRQLHDLASNDAIVTGPSIRVTEQALTAANPPPVAPAKASRGRRGARGTSAAEMTARVDLLERELAYSNETLRATTEQQQTTHEELRSTNEELQSTNEELQSMNEELQASNEELEMSKDELMSLNDVTREVNDELSIKLDQLESVQNDMKNLLDSVDLGVLFLDRHLVIRRYTSQALAMYRLVATDIGRPLNDIKSNLDTDLQANLQAVLDTLIAFQRSVRTTDGTRYLARILPYRTLNNVLEGVTLSFLPHVVAG